MSDEDYDNPDVRKRSLIIAAIGVLTIITGIVLAVLVGGFFIYYCVIAAISGCIMIGLGAYHFCKYTKRTRQVQAVRIKETTEGTTTQRIHYGAGHQPAYSGPQQPTGGWSNDPYPQPQGYMYGQPGPPVPGQPDHEPAYEQSSYGHPGQPSYGQPGQSSYGQPGQPSYGQPGQPSYGQLGQPSYGQLDQPPYGQSPPPPYEAVNEQGPPPPY